MNKLKGTCSYTTQRYTDTPTLKDTKKYNQTCIYLKHTSQYSSVLKDTLKKYIKDTYKLTIITIMHLLSVNI